MDPLWELITWRSEEGVTAQYKADSKLGSYRTLPSPEDALATFGWAIEENPSRPNPTRPWPETPPLNRDERRPLSVSTFFLLLPCECQHEHDPAHAPRRDGGFAVSGRARLSNNFPECCSAPNEA
ncbi:hypothetical protein EVAR_31925_1 [Eumeta japonica]|uniref:Uncharacterized protein n=1 Tax=Eumeta variegata TaxID=151549 RepID=A0A4C1XP33_EUMVA|nr:hypothetical protein EVAR_31925_1 [Eumeta japonica]